MADRSLRENIGEPRCYYVDCLAFRATEYACWDSEIKTTFLPSVVSGEKTCIDCHMGIAHRLPDMSGIEDF